MLVSNGSPESKSNPTLKIWQIILLKIATLALKIMKNPMNPILLHLE